jgi:hypothetical protein
MHHGRHHGVGAVKQKFTDTFLRNLKPEGNRDRDIIEGHGFGVRVRAGGSRVFFYKYRFLDKLRLMNLGTYPQTSLAEARQKYGSHENFTDRTNNQPCQGRGHDPPPRS